MLVDGAVALLLALLAEFELLIADLSPQERIANALTVPFMTLPLVLRRRAPIFALVLMIAASRVQVTVGGTQRDGGTIPILAIMLAIYSMAAAVSLGKALVGAAVVLAVGVTIPPVTTEDVVFRSILEMVPWTLGRVVRSRQRRGGGSQEPIGNQDSAQRPGRWRSSPARSQDVRLRRRAAEAAQAAARPPRQGAPK